MKPKFFLTTFQCLTIALALLPAACRKPDTKPAEAPPAEADAEASETDDNPHSVQPADEWLDVFRKDAQDVLLAELDFRFQPVEGLLDALRTQATRTS